MGDMSEMRGLIVVGSFLAISLLLIAFIPTEFYTSAESRTIEPPDYFESSELINWNFTYIHNVTSSYEKIWGKAEFGHDMRFWAYKGGINRIFNEHGYTFLGFYTGGHKMTWINDDGVSHGVYLTYQILENDWDQEKNLSSYIVRCVHFWMKADFTYNTSLYSSFADAWDNDDLHVIFGIQWSERGTTWNTWSLISSVLFFKPISGVPYILSALIAVPIWLSVAYMAFIFSLRIVGAVFGGGGA